MTWYYATGGQQVGPITDADLEQLVHAGTVTSETLVWHEGLTDWQPYGSPHAGAPATATPGAALDLRPMNIGDILDRTFRLYRSHFMPFFLVMLVVQAISYVFSLAWQMAFWSQVRTTHPAGGAVAAAFLGSFALFIPVIIVIFILNQIGIGTLTAAVSAAFLQQEVSMRKAFQAVRGKLGRLVGATLLNSLMLGSRRPLGQSQFALPVCQPIRMHWICLHAPSPQVSGPPTAIGSRFRNGLEFGRTATEQLVAPPFATVS